MSNELVILGTYNGVEITARASDNYVDMTGLCKAHGKNYSSYADTVAAKRFLAVLSKSLGIPEALLVVRGDGRGNHTFADKRIALHCAAWISPEFEVWVYDKIEELLRQGYATVGGGVNKDHFDNCVGSLAELSMITSATVGKMAYGVGTGLKYISERIEVVQTALDTLSTKISGAVTGALKEYERTYDQAPNEFFKQAPTLLELPDPTPFLGSDVMVRNYINDGIEHLHRWWHKYNRPYPHHTAYRGLYNKASELLKFNIWENFNSYEKKIHAISANTEVNKLDMLEDLGRLDDVAIVLYTEFGHRQPIPFIADCVSYKKIDLAPIGRKAGTVYAWMTARELDTVPVGRKRRNAKTARKTQNADAAVDVVLSEKGKKLVKQAEARQDDVPLASELEPEDTLETLTAAVKNTNGVPVVDAPPANEPFFQSQSDKS